MQSSTGMLTGACAAGGDLRECVALSLPESPQPEQVLSGLPLDLPGPTQPEKTLQRLGGAQTWRFTWAEEALVGELRPWTPAVMLEPIGKRRHWMHSSPVP